MAEKYFDYLPVIVGALFFALLGLILYLSSQRTLERSRKNLSWIKRHGKNGYLFDKRAFPSKQADWLGVFGVAVFALVVSMAAIAVEYSAAGKDWLTGLFSVLSLTSILICVCGAVAMYFLLQLLFGSTVISASVSLLFAASLVGAHTAAAMLSIALLLLILWLLAKQKTLLPSELLFYASVLALCAAVALRPQLLPMVLLFIGLHLYKHIYYLRADREKPGSFAAALLLSLLVWVVGAVVYTLGRVFFNFGAVLEAIWTRYLADPVGITGRMLYSGLIACVRPFMRSRALLPMMDAPLFAIGGFGMISSLLLWLRRKDPRAILALLVSCLSIVIWLLSDISVLSAGLALPAALLYSNFERGEKKLPIALSAALGVLFSLALYFVGYYLPFCYGILTRLA